MRDTIIRTRESVFGALASALWAGWLPAGVRLSLMRALMAREARTSGLSRQLGLLASAVAMAGAAALVREPRRAGDMIRRAQARGGRPLVIAGDSHSKLYVHRARRDESWLLPLHHLATAASARGLGRADTRSGQGKTLERLVEAMKEAQVTAPALLVFGQVDVEFIYMFRRLATDPPTPNNDTSFQGFAATSAEAYVAFAARLADTAQIRLATIFPPALSDDAWRQGYVNANIARDHGDLPLDQMKARLGKADILPLAERTKDHARFNALLGEASQRAGVKLLDSAGVLPMRDGAVDPTLLGRAAGADHHLDGEALRPYLTPLLWRLADEAP